MLKKRKEIPPIVQVGDPVLRSKAVQVDPASIGTPEFESLIDSMIAAMHDAPGIGVAAPQIGVPLQIFVLEDSFGGDDDEDTEARQRPTVPLHVLINPELEPVGDETVEFFEGCLSVSGFAGVVRRHTTVRVKGLDRTGQPIELEWSGWPARILQHEFDHLQGTLYIDRMDTRTFATLENLEAEDD